MKLKSLVYWYVGSDDAKAPNFPAEVLGSRAEAPPDAVGIYSKQRVYRHITELAAINEQTRSVSSVYCCCCSFHS